MIKLDDNLLQELGLGILPPEDKKKMLAHVYETLEMRVGMELAKQMTDAQLLEFEQFIKQNDEAGALRWLETNFPNYKEVVASEFEKLKLEIKQVAPQIVSSMQQQAAQQPAVPPQAQDQPQVQTPVAPSPQSYGQQPQIPPIQAPVDPLQPPQPFPPIQDTQGKRDDFDLAG